MLGIRRSWIASDHECGQNGGGEAVGISAAGTALAVDEPEGERRSDGGGRLWEVEVRSGGERAAERTHLADRGGTGSRREQPTPRRRVSINSQATRRRMDEHVALRRTSSREERLESRVMQIAVQAFVPLFLAPSLRQFEDDRGRGP